MSRNKLIADETEVTGTPQMRVNIFIPSVTINGVFDLDMNISAQLYLKLSSLQITTLETLEEIGNVSVLKVKI